MADPTKDAERVKRLSEAIRQCSTVYAFITTRMGAAEALDVRACKAFRYGASPERIGLVRENTCPSGNTSMQRFCTTKFRESPIPLLLFGDGFHDEDSRAQVNIYWPASLKVEPAPLFFEGELLEGGDNHGRFVSLDEARTKSEFNLKFVHKGMSLRALVENTDKDGRIPVYLLPRGARVFPPMVEIARDTFDALRKVFPNRMFIQAGYSDRDLFSAIPIELPPNWDPSAPAGSKLRAVSGKLFDIVEIVRERPLFGHDADDLEEELEEEGAATARLKKPADHGVSLDGANGAAASTNGANGESAHAQQPAAATT